MKESNIDKQALISAVEEFAFKHDTHQIDRSSGKYRELIPMKTPGPGQQYAFEVDLDKCTGCKACVTACHNENGLDEDETWRSVGMIQGGDSANPAIQHVTSACHHCADPACMNGCPTKAYVKDTATGIVKHLDDQCFGCQYCILKCPYDVPKYNKKKGIVHKCDMCASRLNAGQAPACVRACPNGAIRITLVDQKEVRENPVEFVKIPDAPASDYTFPTTRYKTNKIFPANMVSMDYHLIQPEHAHLPLVFMLVLTQLSVGAFLANLILQGAAGSFFIKSLYPVHILCALCLGLLALGASLLHLGRPQYFYRAILGLKTSWLSREIFAFVIFAHVAIFYALGLIPSMHSFLMRYGGPRVFDAWGGVVLFWGMTGIYCSVKVYKDTRRPFWDNDHTTIKFFLTMVILGFATIMMVSLVYAAVSPQMTMGDILRAFGRTFLTIILTSSVVKLSLEASVFYHLIRGDLSLIKKTAILMTRQLGRITKLRFFFGFAGGILFPSLMLRLDGDPTPVLVLSMATAVFLCSLAGELLERFLFFRAVVPLKMPGGKLS